MSLENSIEKKNKEIFEKYKNSKITIVLGKSKKGDYTQTSKKTMIVVGYNKDIKFMIIGKLIDGTTGFTSLRNYQYIENFDNRLNRDNYYSFHASFLNDVYDSTPSYTKNRRVKKEKDIEELPNELFNDIT